VPVWHEKTKQLVADGKLVVLGITQEQHADRCRLFAQWKGIDWPILHDPLNLVGVDVVPLYIAIDEQGVVRDVKPRPNTLAESFVEQTFDPPRGRRPTASNKLPEPKMTRRFADEDRSAKAWRRHADALVLSGKPTFLTEAISAYRHAVKAGRREADAHFRLGVVYRMRYDLPELRQEGDFQKAVDAWRKALRLRPNQYIFRRRIQQYGPRLDKPYPFYDWIAQARKDIKARGETPVPLAAEPVAAELAAASRKFRTTKAAGPEGDPDGRIHRDDKNLIRLETIVVRSSDKKHRAVQVHVAFHPDANQDAHWNNEAEPLRVWIEKPKAKGVKLSRQFAEFANVGTAVSTEPRDLNFEVKLPRKGHKGSATIRGYALYNVCEGKEGKCLFRRQDFEVKIDLK